MARIDNHTEAQRVKEWRHKLQRGFLGPDLPEDEDMPGYDQLFRTIEEYPNVTVGYLQSSKIGKVMRHIVAMPEIPRNWEFHFRDRGQALLDVWAESIQREAEEENKRTEAASRWEIVDPRPADNAGSAQVEENSATTSFANAPPSNEDGTQISQEQLAYGDEPL